MPESEQTIAPAVPPKKPKKCLKGALWTLVLVILLVGGAELYLRFVTYADANGGVGIAREVTLAGAGYNFSGSALTHTANGFQLNEASDEMRRLGDDSINLLLLGDNTLAAAGEKSPLAANLQTSLPNGARFRIANGALPRMSLAEIADFLENPTEPISPKIDAILVGIGAEELARLLPASESAPFLDPQELQPPKSYLLRYFSYQPPTPKAASGVVASEHLQKLKTRMMADLRRISASAARLKIGVLVVLLPSALNAPAPPHVLLEHFGLSAETLGEAMEIMRLTLNGFGAMARLRKWPVAVADLSDMERLAELAKGTSYAPVVGTQLSGAASALVGSQLGLELRREQPWLDSARRQEMAEAAAQAASGGP